MGILALLAREDWRVGLALSAFAVVALVALRRLEGIAVPHFAAERQASAELFGFVGELLAGTEDVPANGARAYVMRRFYQLMRTLRDRGLSAGLMVNILMNALSLSVALGTAAAFAVSAYLYRTGALTIGTVYLVFRYTSMLEGPIRSITSQLQDLEKYDPDRGTIALGEPAVD